MAKQTWLFLGLAFGLSWLIWMTAIQLGAGPGLGEYIFAFGVAGPAVAAVLVSYRGQKVATTHLPAHPIRFVLLWLLCWAVYVGRTKMSLSTPLSLPFNLLVPLLAMIPASVASGVLSADRGVRDLLRSLVRPQNMRWQIVAFLFFPVILLLPAALVYAFGGTVVSPRDGALWSLAAFGVVTFLYHFFFTAVLEEPGWRGLLLPRLQQKFSPLLASLLVWLPWALWHAPLDFTGGGAGALGRIIFRSV